MALIPPLEADRARLTPYIGREEELGLLRQVFARAMRETSTQLVTIVGDAGMGKSRLVTEFLRGVDERPEPVLWLRGRSLPYGQGIAFWPLREMVRTQAGILDTDTREEAAAKVADQVRTLIRDPSERDWYAGRLAILAGAGSSAGLDEEVERGEWFAAWQRFFQAVASTLPLILVFEDLQWAAPALLDFVEQLVDWSTGVPLLVLCTARPELYDRSQGWGGGKRASTTIGLAPLSAQETVQLLSALLSQAVLPAETQQVLIERSGGNPLYAEEFVRMLVDRGILVRHEHAWRIASNEEIPVPGTAQALIAARLGTLPREQRRLVLDASVFGKVFWAGALAEIEGVDVATVKASLHELVRREVARPSRASFVRGDVQYSIWHPLLRDVAYAQIPPEERPAKHLAVARWFEHAAPERMGEQAEILAHHYAEGLSAIDALPPEEAAQVRDRAARAFVMAGDRVLQLDVAAADAWYGKALALRPQGHPERAAVLVKAARTASLRGDFPDAVDHLQQGADEFRDRGENRPAGEALLDLSYLLWNQGWSAKSRELLAEAVDLLEREPPGRELAACYAQLASDRFVAGQAEEALEWCAKSLALVEELGLDDLRVRALEIRGMTRCDLGDWEGIDDLRESVDRALELGLGQETARAYLNYATFLTPVEGPERALELFGEGVEFAERRGLTFWRMWIRAWELGVLFEIGEWDRLLSDAKEVLDWDPEKGRSTFGVGALLCEAEVLAYRDRGPEALELVDRFLPRARDMGDPQVLAPALAIAAVVYGALGDRVAAARAVDELAASGPQRTTWVRSLFLQIEVRALTEAGRIGDAKARMVHADRTTPRGRLTVLTSEAVLAEAAGDLESAEARYREAANGWLPYGFPLERGRALLGMGRCLARLDRGREAAKALREAKDVFERLRAKSLLAETDALVEEASRHPA
jgi:tetratricopeptide (TPR) repeat protein